LSVRFEAHVRKVALVVVVGAVVSIANTTILNVALEALARDLRAPLADVQWVITAYLLGLAMLIPPTGWASERFGIRRVWTLTMAAFVMTSALCALAWSVESLIVFRALQGLAGGMVMPLAMIALSATVGPHRMGPVIAAVGTPMWLVPAVAPALGGLLVEHLSWRWVFLSSVPVALAAFALGSRLLPRGGGNGACRLDRLGVVLLPPGLTLVTLALSGIPAHRSIAAPAVYWPGLIGCLLIAVFGLHALRAADPLIDVRLFARARVAAGAATTFLLGAVLFGSLVILPLYFQLARGENALLTGILLAPTGLGAAAAMPFTGVLADRFGGGRLVLGGVLGLAAATIPLTQVGEDTPYAVLVTVLLVRGVALGLTMMPILAAVFASLEPGAVPRATSGINVTQRVGGSIGVAVLTLLLQSELVSSDGSTGAAFAHTFWWILALTLLALVPAAVLARSERPRLELEPTGQA
jgi:EmrB/QacA subfamily drug resistance transporter